MSTDEEQTDCRFLILIKANGHSRPHLVMAKDGNAAFMKVLPEYSKHYIADLEMKVFILGESEVESLMPNLKDLAWRYWWEGLKFAKLGYMESAAREEFEQRWQHYSIGTEPHE